MDVLAAMKASKLPINISTDYRHHHTLDSQSRGAVIKTLTVPGMFEIGIHQFVTVHNESDAVIQRALKHFKDAVPDVDDAWTTFWSDAKGWDVLCAEMSNSQVFPDYRHVIPYMKKDCTKEARAMLEAWLRTCSHPKAQAYRNKLERMPSTKGKLTGAGVANKYLEGGGGDHHNLGPLRLLERGKSENALRHGPPLGNTSSKAEQQNAADLKSGARSQAVVSCLHTFGKGQDARLKVLWDEAKEHESDPLAATPKYREKMAGAFERMGGMEVDSVCASGDVDCEKVEVANSRSALRTTHIVDMKVLRAIFKATTVEAEVKCGEPCTDGVFGASGLHSAYTLKAAEHLGVAVAPPVWYRYATLRVQVFNDQPPRQILVGLGALLETPKAVSHPTRKMLLEKKKAGRPHSHRRFASKGEVPGTGNTAKPKRDTKCANCGLP
jgi:hypothetical protein